MEIQSLNSNSIINSKVNSNSRVNLNSEIKSQKCFDLEERTAIFSEELIMLLDKIPKSDNNVIFLKQIIRSGTSIGANYMEANGTRTRKDLRHKITICRKEAKETKYWLRLIKTLNPDHKTECKILITEVHELVLIFSSIINKI